MQNIGTLKDEFRSEELNLSRKRLPLSQLYLLNVIRLVKLLNALFSSCLCKSSGTRCFLLLSFFFFFFFIPNITTIRKNKIFPSSEPEMISKKLEKSYLSYFGVNLTDVVKIIAKYRRKVISKYRQKSLFIAQWKNTVMFIIF